MNLPKFIITMDGFLRLGMVNQHKDLPKKSTKFENFLILYRVMVQHGVCFALKLTRKLSLTN